MNGECCKVETTRNYLFILSEEEDFRVRFVDSNHTVVVSDGIYKQHTHIMYEIILVERGRYRCLLDGCELLLEPWDLLLVQPNQKHEDFLYEGSSLFCFHFHLLPATDKSLPATIFSPDASPCNQKIHIFDVSFFLYLIRQLTVKGENGENGFEYFRLDNAIFSVILRKLLSLYPVTVLHGHFTQQIIVGREVSRLYSVFARHSTDMPGLDELCRETNMSRSSLHRLCHLLFNMPPRKAFIHYKILHIQNFIRENPEFSVKELSLMFGFKTQFHFSRVFRNVIGTWPNFLIKQRKILSRKSR